MDTSIVIVDPGNDDLRSWINDFAVLPTKSAKSKKILPSTLSFLNPYYSYFTFKTIYN